MKLSSYILGAIMLILPVVAGAAFNDVSLTTGTTLTLTVGGSTLGLTVTSGTVEAIRVLDGDLSIDLAAGSSIDLNSSDKFTFTYNKTNTAASFTCGSSSSILNLSLGQGQTTETVSVTPVRTTCVVSTSGGGTGTTSTTAPTTTTTTTTSSTPAPSTTTTSAPATTSTAPAPTAPKPTPVQPTPVPVAPKPAPVTVSRPVTLPVLRAELNPGARSDEVMDLQKLLAKDPTIYPEGIVSGYYGPKTTAAVRKFQAKYGLPAVGRVGPATLAKLNEVYGTPAQITAPSTPSTTAQTANQIQSQIQAIQQQIQAITSGTAAQVAPVVAGSVSIDSELNPGARNDEVMDLQKLLAKDPTIYPEGIVSGYYGPKTTAAVRKFQAKYGLSAVGRVGPATLQKINEILGGSSVSAPIAPLTPSYVAPAAPSSAASSQAQQIADQIKAIQVQIDAILKK